MGKRRLRWILFAWLVGCGSAQFTTVGMDGGTDAGDATVRDSGQRDDETPGDSGLDANPPPFDGPKPMDSSSPEASAGDSGLREGGNPADSGPPPPRDSGSPADTGCVGLACSSTAECQACSMVFCCCGNPFLEAGVCTLSNACGMQCL